MPFAKLVHNHQPDPQGSGLSIETSKNEIPLRAFQDGGPAANTLELFAAHALNVCTELGEFFLNVLVPAVKMVHAQNLCRPLSN